LRVVVVVGMVIVAVPGAAADPTPVPVPRAQAIAVADEIRFHPDAAADDVYKFLHQGVFGPGHAIADRQSAARALDEEVAGLPPATVNEPLCQPLGGPAPMARIHLRAFLAAREDTAALLDVFRQRRLPLERRRHGRGLRRQWRSSGRAGGLESWRRRWAAAGSYPERHSELPNAPAGHQRVVLKWPARRVVPVGACRRPWARSRRGHCCSPLPTRLRAAAARSSEFCHFSADWGSGPTTVTDEFQCAS
jgi:hypothetical protein